MAPSSVSEQVRKSPEADPRSELSHILPQLILGRFITTVISVLHTVMFLTIPRGNCAIVGCLQLCFGQLSFALWSAVPTADIGFCSFSIGPPVPGQLSGAPLGEQSHFCAKGIDDEPDKWVNTWLEECQ